MSNTYLLLAEEMLLSSRQPMSAKEMLDRAYLLDRVPPHLYGATQHKTLHARLSEDISKHSEQSTFYRTAPGVFFLSSLRDVPSTPESFKNVHLAPPRKKELKRDTMLAVPRSFLDSCADENGRIDIATFYNVIKSGDYRYLPWRTLRNSAKYVAVHSFLAMHRDLSVLSYRKGRFRTDYDPLFSPRCIGFGGAVFSHDVDMLFDSMLGVIESGIRDLSYGVGLNKHLAEEARYRNQVQPLFALASLGNTQTVLDVVLGYRCPDDFTPTKSALSSNDLRWLSFVSPPNDLGTLDNTSRKIFELGWSEGFNG